jgi:hypothetical protein
MKLSLTSYETAPIKMPDPNPTPGTDPVPPVITPEQPPVPPTVPPVDYEKKFSESSRENQILRERIAAEEKARQELTKEPTDSDIRTAFPNWEEMSETEKGLARRTLNAERTAQSAAQKADAVNSDREWNTSLEIAVTSNAALQGKEQQFKQYASKPQYRNVPMDVLVDAFLNKFPAAPSNPTPKPGLEPGSGGPRKPETPNKISAENLQLLRKTNPKAYAEYIKKHSLEDMDLG